jgi:hypothetical protein
MPVSQLTQILTAQDFARYVLLIAEENKPPKSEADDHLSSLFQING